MKRYLLILFLLCAIQAWAEGRGEPQIVGASLTVFNAASTTDLIDEAGALFTDQTGIKVKTNPGSSGVLAKQIYQGAPADIYISASGKWMTYVEEEGLTLSSSPFVSNSLVLVTPLDSPLEFFEMTETLDLPSQFSGRLSLGDPDHVPAGAYAKEALDFFGWYPLLKDRLQPGADVRGALAVVEMGEVEMGIVYSSDALKSQKVRVVSAFPDSSHSPIEYYCGTVKGCSPEGELFYQFLLESEDVEALYLKYGFVPTER